MPERRLLVFDLDDTLYPEHAFVLSGFRAAAEWLDAQHGISGFYESAAGLFESGLRGTVFDAALAELGLDASVAGPLVAALVAVYRSHAPRIALHDDAQRALDRLGRVQPLGLLTDGFAATQRNKVKALGIAPRFTTLVYSDDLGRDRWKPSPAPYRQIMETTGFEGAGCVYVADNPCKDFVAPRALGWWTVRIRREGGEYARMPAPDGHEPHVEIASLDDLDAVLAKAPVAPIAG